MDWLMVRVSILPANVKDYDMSRAVMENRVEDRT